MKTSGAGNLGPVRHTQAFLEVLAAGGQPHVTSEELERSS